MLLRQNVCFDFLCNFRLKHFPFYEEMSKIWSKMFIDTHMKYPSLLSDFNETWIFWADFRTRIKYYENPLSGSRVVPCGQTDRHDEANSRFSQILRTRLKCKFFVSIVFSNADLKENEQRCSEILIPHTLTSIYGKHICSSDVRVLWMGFVG